jgi:hypothetical protein
MQGSEKSMMILKRKMAEQTRALVSFPDEARVYVPESNFLVAYVLSCLESCP